MGTFTPRDEQRPSAEYSPLQVLELVLAAFADVNSGASALYDFANDSLRAKAGDLSDLRRMFDNELFAPLAGAHKRLVETFDERGEVARAEVRAQDARYVISLARRDHGRFPDCWLITAIARDQGAGY